MAIPSYLHSNPLVRWLMWRRYRVIARFARLESGPRVLEFGCGIGIFLPTLARYCPSVQAIDIFPQFAVQLCGRFDLKVQFPNSLSEVADGSLDLIIAADVLEHLSNPDAVIRRFVRKLDKNGRLVVSGPTENRVYQAGRVLAGFRGKGGYHHSDIDHVAAVIERCGFRLRRKAGLPFVFPPHLFRVLEYVRLPSGDPQ